ncbi:family 20 glycosylhydrolase [Streptomyces sp. CS014]|uniref:family 20 glycosylhydrolase n=1 Tax=Streptomyces sp. CS014 TaxID=2162707 RepID=UPI001EF563CB|nr:family 20 glycosylhydrolase [Streptomyces sp. CS014]
MELQAYAAERFVTLVPEIDLPAHCAILREALPGLPDAPAPEGLAGRFPFVPPVDLADPATAKAVATILDDVCRLTDGPFVHIGGDAAVGATEDSFVRSIRELRSLVRGFGKRPVGWQESSRAGIGPEDIAQFWVDVPMIDLPDTAEELAARPELLAAARRPPPPASASPPTAPSASSTPHAGTRPPTTSPTTGSPGWRPPSSPNPSRPSTM